MIRIVRPGIATTFQDRGRPGLAHIGVTRAGAVDVALADLVNRLVGNHVAAAVIETIGELEIEAVRPTVLAASPAFATVSLAPGERYAVPAARRGRAWQYLAIRGGFDVPAVLGSYSFDTLSGLGPAPPAAGDECCAADHAFEPIVVDQAPVADLIDLARIGPGPRDDWFTADARRLLTASEWTVATSSRVGVRLAGPRLERCVHDELPSEGLIRGAIQVPPDGQPVMMLADHPTTGGYPVIAVVHRDDVATVAQHSGGTSVRFRPERT